LANNHDKLKKVLDDGATGRLYISSVARGSEILTKCIVTIEFGVSFGCGGFKLLCFVYNHAFVFSMSFISRPLFKENDRSKRSVYPCFSTSVFTSTKTQGSIKGNQGMELTWKIKRHERDGFLPGR
jgi:hypothetical protein